MRVRGAPLPRDRVHPLHVLAAQVIQHLGDQAHALVLPHAGRQELIQPLIRRIHHGARLRQQADLLAGLDPPRLQEHLLPVSHLRCPAAWSAASTGISATSMPDRLAGQPVLAPAPPPPGRPRSRRSRRRGAARRAASRSPPAAPVARRSGRGRRAPGVIQPRVVQLMVAGRRAEVPHHRLPAPRQQREPDQLVHRPRADMRRRHVPDIGEIKTQQGAQRRGLQLRPQPGQPARRADGPGRLAVPSRPPRAVSVDRHRQPPPCLPACRPERTP